MKVQKKGKKIMIIISCIILFILTVIGGRIFFLTSSTTGKHITNYGNDKAALIVIDIQEDTLSIPQYNNTNELIQNINLSIKYANENGIDIIYIRQEYSHKLDLIISGGMYKTNTKGAALSTQLLIKSDNIFSKLRADASACVYKTSLGGVNRGYNVVILKDCIFSVNKNTLNKMLQKYEKAGIEVEEMNDFLQYSIN